MKRSGCSMMVKAFQSSFNAMLFDESKEFHMDKRGLYIGDGFEYTLSTYIKFVRRDDASVDELSRKYDFVDAMYEMGQVMKYPLVPRYIALIYSANYTIYVYDLTINNYFRDYMKLKNSLDGRKSYSSVVDSNFEVIPLHLVSWQEGDVSDFVSMLQGLTSCMNTDENLSVFDSQSVINYPKYSVNVLSRYVNWDDGKIVLIYEKDRTRALYVRHEVSSDNRTYSDDHVVSVGVPALGRRSRNMLKQEPPVVMSPVLDSPRGIYDYLKSKVYRQDDYCKWASSIIYNHVNGVPSIYLVSGPSGCGKTYLWECVREIYGKVVILDTSTITQVGFKGWNLNEMMRTVKHDDGIVIFDEFDKMCKPTFDGGGGNISFNVQSNFLKLLDEGIPECIEDETGRSAVVRSTKDMTFILCGSFSEKADEIAKKASGGRIGFASDLQSGHAKAYDNDITIDDVVEYGVIKELASRIIGMTCVRPLSLDDYIDFIGLTAGGTAVQQITDKYGYKVKISKKVRMDIAKSAYDCGLGLRNVTNRLRQRIDREMFDQWEQLQETNELILR